MHATKVPRRRIMSRFVLFLFVIFAFCGVGWSLSRQKRILSPIFESRSAAASTCTGCSKKITLVEEGEKYIVPEYSITPEEFTALRIEYIKNQILKKLRLKEKPQVSMPHLPKPVRENDSILPSMHDDEVNDGYSENFYGKTTQAIIFPYEGKFLYSNALNCFLPIKKKMKQRS